MGKEAQTVDLDLRSMDEQALERLVAAGVGDTGADRELAERAMQELKYRWGNHLEETGPIPFTVPTAAIR